MNYVPELGKLAGSEDRRDAVHIAVAPVIAQYALLPGEHISLNGEGKAISSRDSLKCIGIVDPFLQQHVEAGDRFWLFLYPGTVTSLRHVWTHPAFTAKVPGIKE